MLSLSINIPRAVSQGARSDWREARRQIVESGVWTACLSSHQTGLGPSSPHIFETLYHHIKHSLTEQKAVQSHEYIMLEVFIKSGMFITSTYS